MYELVQSDDKLNKGRLVASFIVVLLFLLRWHNTHPPCKPPSNHHEVNTGHMTCADSWVSCPMQPLFLTEKLIRDVSHWSAMWSAAILKLPRLVLGVRLTLLPQRQTPWISLCPWQVLLRRCHRITASSRREINYCSQKQGEISNCLTWEPSDYSCDWRDQLWLGSRTKHVTRIDMVALRIQQKKN